MSRITFPAEWHSQSGILISWPDKETDWADSLPRVECVYLEFTEKLSRQQPVVIIYRHQEVRSHITTLLTGTSANNSNIHFFQAEFDDTWIRDYGPLSTYRNRQPRLLDFQFNGWGNKFRADRDNRINRSLVDAGVIGSLETVPFILEGGSIDTDGNGSILTTTSCLLDAGRNRHTDRAGIEHIFKQYLGCDRVLWLENGYLAGDDTDGHIDTLARFCSTDTIVYMHCDDPEDEHFHCLEEMQTELGCMRTREGKPYRLVPLNIPEAVFDENHQRLPASYANFLITNQAVFMPVYGDTSADQHAVNTIQSLFPYRQVISIDCKPLIMQHGSLHCITMQLSKGMLQI